MIKHMILCGASIQQLLKYPFKARRSRKDRILAWIRIGLLFIKRFRSTVKNEELSAPLEWDITSAAKADDSAEHS
jgi:hypothetical protein